MTAEEVLKLRLALRAKGFTPIPLFGKAPPSWKKHKVKGLTDWPDLRQVSPEQINMWSRQWPDAINTGCLTRSMPTLDIDLLNEEAARAVEDHVREHFEERGRILVRIGKPPKRAILFRTIEPFDKITANLVATNGSKEKLELLADGEQLVVAGIHPDTRQPYIWFGGAPWEIAHEELPYIREAEARALVADVVDLLIRDFGLHARAGAAEAQEQGQRC